MKNCEFIDKLIVMMKEYPNHINWAEGGKKVRMEHLGEIEQMVLQDYFRHANFSSFVRQLNMYGFCKKEKSKFHLDFQHPIFRKGNQSNFHHIVRKSKMRTLKKSEDKFKQSNAALLSKLNTHKTLSSQLKEISIQMFSYHDIISQTLKLTKNHLNSLFFELKDARTPKVIDRLGEIKLIVDGELDKSLMKAKTIGEEIKIYSKIKQEEVKSECSLDEGIFEEQEKNMKELQRNQSESLNFQSNQIFDFN